jgi:hypothetical protein
MVLTPEEKRVILFVLIAFLLGVTVKLYRDRHPQPPAESHARARALAPR